MDFVFFKNFCNIYYIKKSNVRLNSNSSTSNCNFNFLETMILFKKYTNLEKFETQQTHITRTSKNFYNFYCIFD